MGFLKKVSQHPLYKQWPFSVMMGLLLVLVLIVGLLIWKVASFEPQPLMQESSVSIHAVTPSNVDVIPSIEHQAVEILMDDAPLLMDKYTEPVKKVEKSVDEEVLPVTARASGMALIIDDMGYDVHALERLLALSIPLTISILPNGTHAVRVANMTHQAGQMVMLHLPMEPMGEHYRNRMDNSFLRVGMDEATVRQMMLADLAHIPYIEGINNHMGSRLTSMIEPMTWVMQVCREKKLFFVDSKTSSKSLAAMVAKQYGLSWGSRSIFLDDSVKLDMLEKSWRKIERCVQRQQHCIVIAHPHRQSLDFLESKLSVLQDWPMLPLRSMLHQAQYKK
ncbi:MAG: divergent polysaccharide deacetylase family protein [Mariprofundaceae bacterium]|nr:divergent polysaccharide deacetylase family protein [Mariprofundaceae bacterium]